MTKEKQNVLIAGANGTTGRIIIELLRESDVYRPIAMLRKQTQKEHFEQKNVAVEIADLESDLSHVVKNVASVIFAAGSKGTDVINVDQEGAKRLIDAAKKANVGKFIMLSSMGVENPSEGDDLEDYFRAKQNADNYLKSSGLNYSILRPGALTDKDGTGKVQLKRKIDINGSITRADVAKTLVTMLAHDVMKNQTLEILAGEVPIETAVSQE
jgi:uncharacterized protein YbjT (DUF2867 family)